MRLCLDGAKTVVIAPLPESSIEKGRADLSVLVYLAVAKFVDHLPLDRIRKIFRLQSVRLQTSALCDWIESVPDLLLPVYLAMPMRSKNTTSSIPTTPSCGWYAATRNIKPTRAECGSISAPGP